MTRWASEALQQKQKNPATKLSLFLFQLVKSVKFLEILMLLFSKYRCELCTHVNMEIDTSVKTSTYQY